ncbi:MAG: DNA polymerase III subunit gamma/tau [Cellulosilyticaceae bacterium]
MSYLALYRKYRPWVFEDVVGQEHIVKTLQNQINADRVSHAYLFTGSRGTGKTSVAKIFARAVNCESPIDGSACMECESCKKIQQGASINIIEIDAASHNGVDNIREINEEVKYSPAIGKYKVYIIDEVHMLSGGAFNALLKTLEEPPSHVIFILATTDPQKIPVTILSRCQRFDFKRLTANQIQTRLSDYMVKENVQIAEDALGYIARLADGGMRDALSLLEQCISFYFNEEITLDKVLYIVGAVDSRLIFEMIEVISNYNSKRAIEICDIVNTNGRSIRQFTTDLLVHTRNLLVSKTTNGETGVLDYSSEYIESLTTQANTLSVSTLMHYMKVFSELDQELKIAPNQRVILEVAILKLSEVSMDESSNTLLEKIALLEQKLMSLEKDIHERPIAVPVEANSQGTLKQEVVPKVLPKAVPEDIKKLVKMWPEIIATLNKKLNPMAMAIFRTMTPGILEDDILYIVHPKGMDKTLEMHFADLRDTIQKIAGKEVRMVSISAEDYKQKSVYLYGTRPERTDVVVAIEDTLKDIQSKLNYDTKVVD